MLRIKMYVSRYICNLIFHIHIFIKHISLLTSKLVRDFFFFFIRSFHDKNFLPGEHNNNDNR